MWAAQQGHISIVEYLTSQGGDIHTKDNVSKSILMTSHHVYSLSFYVIRMDTHLLCMQQGMVISLLSSISPLKEGIYMLRIM